MGLESHYKVHDARTRPNSSDATASASTSPLFAEVDSTVVRDAPVAIYTTDLDGKVLSWNRAAEELYGWSADEVLGGLVPIVSEEEKDALIEVFPGLLSGQSTVGIELSPAHRDGHRLRVLVSVTPICDEQGTPTAVTCIAVDVSAQHEAHKALAATERKWRTLIESVSDTVTIIDANGQLLSATKDFDYSFGLDGFSWTRSGVALAFAEEDEPRARAALDEVLANPGKPVTEVLRVIDADGHEELAEITGVNRLDDPAINGIVITSRYVTDVKLAQALLADEATVLELIARGAPLGEVLDGLAKLVEYHTGGTSGIFLLPSTVPADCAVTASLDLLEPLDKVAALGASGPCSEAIEKNRTIVVEDIADSPLFDGGSSAMLEAGYRAAWSHPIVETETGEVLGTIAVYYSEPRQPTDRERSVVATAAHLTAIAVERDRVHRHLEFQANHDQLTGLPNRVAILEAVDRALERSRSDGTAAAVLLIDLDRFKVINDSLGHGAGDSLLMRFGDRLRSLVRPDDFVGHFGSDEFVVVLDHIKEVEDIRHVTSRLDLALREPFIVGDNEIFLSTSIGVALSTSQEETSNELLQHADVAMYRAKDRGRDRIEIFDHAMRAEAVEQLRIDRELRLAIERAQLRLHYQPKIDLDSGRIVGVEALLRWEHPERGLVLPGEFIGVAEETGLIVRIGTWVIEEAVRQARSWVDRLNRLDRLAVAVNLSARQLSSPGLVTHISRVLERYQWPADWFTLEITESILVDDSDTTLTILRQLKGLGLKLAIDDFGTGFSSLSYLHRFPVDIVKVDRAFVAPLRADGESSPVATAVVHMARALGLMTAAEGVEEPWQLAGVRTLGCDLAQGFYFAKALPAEELLELLSRDATW